MSLLESLRVAMEALAANKLRSILTMLGIIIGVGSVIAILAMGRGTEAAVRGELENIGTGQFYITVAPLDPNNPNQRQQPFTETDLKNIQLLLPDVEMVNTSQGMSASIRYEKKSARAGIAGTYANYLEFNNDKLAAGRWFSKPEEEAGARVVILGQGAIRRLMGENVTPESAVGKSISVNGYPFAVIGVREKPTGLLANMASSLGEDDNSYLVPITWVRRMTGSSAIWNVMVKVKPTANPNEVMKDAIALVERNHKDAKYMGQTFDQFLGVITTVMKIITGVLSAVGGISLVVGGVGIMNIMLVSVTERTREVGIRKAVGASYRDILAQFLIEAVMLSLIGGIIGLGLAAVPTYFVGRWLRIPLLLDWVAITLALGFSVSVGVIFGVYPASKAARLDPIEALRYE